MVWWLTMVREYQNQCESQSEAGTRIPLVLIFLGSLLLLVSGAAASSVMAIGPAQETDSEEGPLEKKPRQPLVEQMIAEPGIDRERDRDQDWDRGWNGDDVRRTAGDEKVSPCDSSYHALEFDCSFDRQRTQASSSDDGTSAQGTATGVARASVAEADEWVELALWGEGLSVFAILSLMGVRLVGGWAFLRAFLPAGWRLDHVKVQEHPTRRVILDHLEKHPGATAQELAETAGVGNNRAVYHISILVREELLSVRTLEGRKHYFVRSAPKADPERLRLRRSVRASRPTGRVLLYLVEGPGATVSQVARVMGFSPGHAHYHLTKLAKQGLVDRLRRGRRVRHYLTELGHHVAANELQAGLGVSSEITSSKNEDLPDSAAAPA